MNLDNSQRGVLTRKPQKTNYETYYWDVFDFAAYELT